MVKMGMNYLAILVGAIAAWIFGAAYYFVFGPAWMAVSGATGSGTAVGPMVLSFVALLVMAWCLSGMVGRLGAAQVTVKNAILYAVTGWLGFTMTAMAVNNAFPGRPALLTIIDGGHWLGVALILGFVIGKFGVRG